MKSRWFRALLALIGIFGAITAGVLTAIVTAERVQLSAPAVVKTQPMALFEPQESSAQFD